MTKTAKHLTFLAAFSALALGACSKSDDAASSDKGAATSGKAAAAKAATPMAATIASMAVTIDVPEDSLVDDNTATAHFPSGTLYANPTIFLMGANDMFWKKDMASQKTEIEKSPGNTFKAFTKEEAIEGGFHLEFDLASMMDPKETLYGFHVRTTIAGKEIDCSSNTSSPEERERGVAMCKTLRAAE